MRIDVVAYIGLIQLDVCSFDREFPSRGHGIPRVHRKVHQDLINLATICFDRSKIRTETHLELNILAYQPVQHFAEIRHHNIQIQHLGLKNLSSTEGEKLTGEGGCALTCTLDFFEFFSHRIFRAKPAEPQLTIANDGGQQVIEVVRYSARQPSNGFHLLRLA